MKPTKLDKAYAEIEKFIDHPERQKDISLAYALLLAHRQMRSGVGNPNDAIALIQNLDHAAGAIYDRIGNNIYPLAMQICGGNTDVAEKLVRAAFFGGSKNIHNYDGSTPLVEFMAAPLIEKIKKTDRAWLKEFIRNETRRALTLTDEGTSNPIPFPGLRPNTLQNPPLPPGTVLKFGGQGRGGV